MYQCFMIISSSNLIFYIFKPFTVYKFLTMKAIKLDVEFSQKPNQPVDNDNYLNALKDFKRKYTGESKNKAYDPDANKMETKNNSALKLLSEESEPVTNETKFTSQKNQTNDNDQNQSRSSLKLPSINVRGSKRPSYEHRNELKQEISDLAKENKLTGQGTSSQPKYKGIGKTNLTEDNEGDKVSSFLKYIQIKSMKPTQKSSAQKNDMSVRDLKLTREEKSIPLKLNRISDKETSPALHNKESQNMVRIKKNQQKSQKTISNYTIKKQRRAVSISQNAQHPSKKKLTNSYYDFCNYVCLLNKVQRPITPVATYKAYVAKGNNSILVKNCLKSRFWWNIGDFEAQANLHWAQTKDQKFVDSLKSYENPKQGKNESERHSIQFLLPKDAKETIDKNQHIREYTNSGLNRFLSEQERKQFSKNQYQVEIQTSSLEQLGNPNKNKIHNHLEYHWHISNKKALYYNLKKYYTAMKEDPFQFIPLTFHIQKFGDQEWQRFVQAYSDREQDMKKKKENGENKDKAGKKKKEKNLWIVKPGQNSNQGNGIQVFDNCQQIAEMVKSSGERPNGKQRSYIIQRYLMPFLYCKRKFDIRCYVLVTSVKGVYKAYWYEEGYIRTSSKEFTLKNLKNRFIHLTNDAVQKKSEDYGKYENGNKISFADFQKYLDNSYPEKEYKFFKTVYPSMIKRAADAIKSTCMLMDSKKRQYTFEIFGLDFMIDEDFATWLIEVNTNPCLELSSPLLARIIPNMVENALKIAVDPLFPPPKDIPKTKNLPIDAFETNKFTLIFNSSEDQEILANLIKDTNLSNIVESDQEDDNHDEID